MVALRSLSDEREDGELRRQVERAERLREHERRLRNNHVCNSCGLDRDDCVCDEPHENYGDDSGIDVGVE